MDEDFEKIDFLAWMFHNLSLEQLANLKMIAIDMVAQDERTKYLEAL